VETVWLTCSPKLEKTQPAGCYIADSTHLVLKIQRHAISAQVRDRPEVLGIATLDETGAGYYAYVFYDRVRKLAEERRLKHRLLGCVLAHEIGHLMLGSTSHSIGGIMSGQWSGEGLRRVSEGGLYFAPLESRKMMRDRLGFTLGGLAHVAPIAVNNPNAPATESAQTDTEPAAETYMVFGATPAQEAALRAQIQVMHPDVQPLRVFFLPHWKHLAAARDFHLRVPVGYGSLMFTHLPSRTVFIDNDRCQGEDWLAHWVAHELGHLVTNSTKEEDAERAAHEFRRRLKDPRKQEPPVGSSSARLPKGED
jgi:hypothetical protein